MHPLCDDFLAYHRSNNIRLGRGCRFRCKTAGKKAKQIHTRIVTFDNHLDLPFDYVGASADGKTQFDLPKAARGKLKGAALAVFVPQGQRTPEGFAKAKADADKKYQLIKAIADDNP